MLRRLRDVPPLLAQLPFDPEFPFSDVYLSRTHTSTLLYDTVTRQGLSNTIDKVVKLGAEAVVRRTESYMANVQIWLRQLASLVGDHAWYALDAQQQLGLAALRGEYIFYTSTEDMIQPLGAGGGRLDAMRWNIPTIGQGVLKEKLLSVIENQRATLEAQMTGTTAKVPAHTPHPHTPPARPPRDAKRTCGLHSSWHVARPPARLTARRERPVGC